MGTLSEQSSATSGASALSKLKSADEVRTNSTTLTADAELFVPLLAGAIYLGDLLLFYDAATAGDFKISLDVPAGATIRGSTQALLTSATGVPTTISGGSVNASGASLTRNAGGVGVGTPAELRARFVVRMGGTAGNIALSWAQVTGDASNFSVFTDSMLRLERLSPLV